MVGMDKKGEAFWYRICQYCQESNHGVIKRGIPAIRKRWQRINEGAQCYGLCYEQAERKKASGSNIDNIIEVAHKLHRAKYKKKCNFDKHWVEFRRQPKWRTPSTITESTKRTKLSNSGMMGSIDCMHWQWKNYPKAWKRMFLNGHKGVPTILPEAVASSNLWICHAFFGVAGSNNDINVLDRSQIFDEVLEGRAPEINYNINGNNYNMGYYLTDEIYLEWATFVKTILRPQGEKRKLFSKYQEGQRKDVERAFSVLQSRFAIVRGPTKLWNKDDLAKIMRTCILLHNMITDDERDTYASPFGPLSSYDDATNGLSQPNLGEKLFAPYEIYIQSNIRICGRQKLDLVGTYYAIPYYPLN